MRFFILMLTLTFGSIATAQGTFQPVIEVNNAAITAFELDQRKRMLQFFRTPGDLDKAAREALIDDRLKQGELRRAGLRMTDESLQAAMTEFAGRANMDLPQFLQLLKSAGVAEQTLRDFVQIGVTWRDFVRSRFGGQVTITDAQVDRAIAQTQSGGSQIEVLLNEIIIAAPPPRADQAMATAQQISQLKSISAFEAQARRVSAIPSRANGGRLGWLPITNYPPQLQTLILNLSPGEVTAPLPITNGVALFQMRDIREGSAVSITPTQIDYATFFLAGGQSEAGLRAALNLTDNIDTCNDLYGQVKGQPATVLNRQNLPPSEIPQDVALELARLDVGEVSYNLTRANGQTLMFLMLCGRTNAASEGVDPDAVRNQLRSQRLGVLADALLEDLRSSAIIQSR